MPTDTFNRLVTIKGARVLLVEDNDLNQQVATELLRDAGCLVDLAENGQVALDQLKLNDYDIVLMDMQMPVMDGVTATRQIRKEARYKDLPVVAMTANAMQGDRLRCLEAGMNDHVAKPIEPDDLWLALLKWIKPRHGRAAGIMSLPQLATEVELPRGIEGLDMVDGLHRVLGKTPLYLWMLRKFVAEQKSAPTKISASLQANDWPGAEQLAHTLKGVAGNIGAVDLQQLAEKLESAIREKQPRQALDDRLDDLSQSLAQLIALLEQKLPAEIASKSAAVDPELLKAVCNKLESLLAEGNAAAWDMQERHASLLNAAFPKHYCQIQEGIRSFDFEAALTALREATAISSSTESP